MWEKPSYEVINVGAEVTAYIYTEDGDETSASPSDSEAQADAAVS